MEGLTEGRIVHYVLPSGRNKGEHRAATVVRVWNKDKGLVNLIVHIDRTNDYDYVMGDIWVTSIEYSEDPKPQTWHWIEKA
jgi:hypothetical protein